VNAIYWCAWAARCAGEPGLCALITLLVLIAPLL